MENNIKKYKLNVEGMSCGHCARGVETAVSSLPGVLSAEVDLETKTLAVKIDISKTKLTEIKEAVDEAGFTVI